MNNTLTALKGVKVGHSTHLDKLTGCTVVLFDKPCPVAYKAYGGSTGTYNIDAFNNGKSDYYAHSIFISGGSWTGLQSGAEITKRLIEKEIGYKAFKIINPNVTGAIVFDLGTRIDKFNPTFGREAVDKATNKPVERGNVGAGTGTAVGKFQYLENGKMIGGMKAGVGSSRVSIGKAEICALSVVNALGNIINPDGSILAGNRDENNKFKTFDDLSEFVTTDKFNTTISIVGINVDLGTRENYERVAQIASHGQIRAINPVNTSVDGDTVFVFSTEEIKSFMNPRGAWFQTDEWHFFPVDIIAQAAAKAVQESIYDACYQAESIKLPFAYKGIIPSVKDYK